MPLSAQTVTVGTFEDYVDLDGDGIIEKDDDNDPDAFAFTNTTDAELSTPTESNEITIAGITGHLQVTGKAYKNGVLTTDFTVEVSDQIKLALTSDAHYDTTKSATIDIAGVDYTWSVTTKEDDRQQITVFDSGQPAQDGDFGFANAQAWCNTEATALSLTGTIIPWLSNDAIGGDALGSESFITQITEDPVNPRQVQSIGGGLIASRWSEFFSDEDTDSPANLERS